MKADEVCQFLEWDSGFFGVKIARVTGHRLSPERAAEVLHWAEDHRIDCLYFLAETDQATVRVAEDHQFRLTDIRVTLEAQLAAGGESERWQEDSVRAAAPEDIPLLRAIAGCCHTDSRFYNDPHFARHLCDELYRIWIEKSCRGEAQMVLVADLQGKPAGYVTCHLHEPGRGQIGLAGIAGGARNLGLGCKLVGHALRWFSTQNVSRGSVVTQGRNVNAQRLYQRCGFLTSSVQLWYHLWLSRPGSGITPC
jgi:dTDP-4-amino-4,6-dideoxy-D-galactose acyltransferase